MPIDEMSNEDLARKGHSEHILRIELQRVDGVIARHTMNGADLSYFFGRGRILRQLLGSGTRSVLL